MKNSCFFLFIFSLLAIPGAARSDNHTCIRFIDIHRARQSERAVTVASGEELPSSTDSILRLWLSPQIVNNCKPAVSTFYFWTSMQELDSVIGQQRLLRTNSPEDPLADLYLQCIEENTLESQEMANHLFSGERQRIHTAWPSYWSTLTESDQPREQDQLVKVVLMDSSLIVAFSPDERKGNRWAVYDLGGNVIPLNKALERKRHIAAVFFSGKNSRTYAGPRRYVQSEYYRTFVLCNENMIRSWHHAVPGMQAKIIQDLDYLLLMNSYFSEGWLLPSQGKRGKIARASWTMPESKMKMNNYFFATQRFAWMTGVDACSEATRKIIDSLRERWPRQVKPCERYPGK